jgi:hypothetical protein
MPASMNSLSLASSSGSQGRLIGRRDIRLRSNISQGTGLADYPIPNGVDAAEPGAGKVGDAARNSGSSRLIVVFDAKCLARRGDGIPEKFGILNAEKTARLEHDWHGYSPL